VPSQTAGNSNLKGDKRIMFKQYIICLLIVILPAACATYADKKLTPATDPAAESPTQPEQKDSDEFRNSDKVPALNWQPFKGVLLHHIVANCCFSETQNTVVLGQDSNGDRKVDRCYQLKGKEGKIYYRILACPDDLAPVKAPQRGNNLQCSLY
jgi:hypothetical protein